MATKTYQEWFDEMGRKMMLDDSYDRAAYGQAQWNAATKAAEEKFTSTNTQSTPCANLKKCKLEKVEFCYYGTPDCYKP